MPVTVCIVGASGSGKTTLLERLVPALQARGVRVATVKHAHDGYQIDEPGTDSARHLAAGASPSVLVGPGGVVTQAPPIGSLAHVVSRFAFDADLVLAEGFSDSPGPKVLVHRNGAAVKWPTNREEVVIAVTDESLGVAREVAPSEIDAIADLLEGLVDRGVPDVRLVVDGQEIVLSEFVRKFVTATVAGMLSALKGVPQSPRDIELVVRHE